MKTFKQFLEESEDHISEPPALKFKKKTAKVIRNRSKEIAKRVAKDIKRQKKKKSQPTSSCKF